MAQLELDQIAYRHPAGLRLENISFSLASGHVGALVGASGSGKTTLLKLIAGFLTPQAGSIRINQQDISTPSWQQAPHHRGVGLVFQQHALLPHLTAAQNIAFGFRGDKKAGQERTQALLADFRILPLAGRYPHQLSGGEAQRVALARAMAAQPSILLMDEPFSSIDSALRRQLRQECMQVLRQAGITVLLVTHDAEEAMELADQIIVLEDGRIAQQDTAHEVYYHPKTPHVASLFGEINHLREPKLIASLTGTAATELLIRPEAILLVDGAGVEGTITQMYYRGNHEILHVLMEGGITLKVHAHHHHYSIGQRVRLAVQE